MKRTTIKKKASALLMALAMTLSMAACAPQERTTDASAGDPTNNAADLTTTASAGNSTNDAADPATNASAEPATNGAANNTIDNAAEALTYTPGTYTATAAGYNGPMTLAVTFSENSLTAVEVTESVETSHVGSSAFDILIADAIAANGSGIDSVSGATFTSRAVKEALNNAAEQAQVSDPAAFQKNTIQHEAQAPIELTYDVVVVGAGGAGMAAAAQAAQNGDTVLILEKNVEMGGNTLVAGGAYQSVMDYLVWDAQNPDAVTGEYLGATYDRITNNIGRLDILRTILNWSEKPFDGTIDADHPFVAGDIKLNAVRGVHPEYLELLKTLKGQIKKYLDWADAKIAAGAKETDLALFSTQELHIFQTYYGGLRPSADQTQWIYSNYDLVRQIVENGQDLKPWLTAQGAKFDDGQQFTIVGSLWQRVFFPLDGFASADGIDYGGNWGAYFQAPYDTITKANSQNALMTRTAAQELIIENGRVTGVKATQYDGTPVTAHAAKGVILATGGYAANIQMVQETNVYWKPEYIANNIGTTNRNSLQGDGIRMAQAIGAAVEGMGWVQMMPLGWVNDGNLSGGAGEGVIFINAATGKRYVDESAERDVLSAGGFENGMSQELAQNLGLKYVPGIYVELSNPEINLMYGGGPVEDMEGRQYTWSLDELAENLGLDKQTLIDTITEYDNYVMGLTDSLEIEKLAYEGTIGHVETDADGKYKPETYTLDEVFVRFMAPSTHHTMGGLKVDAERHVLDENGNAIAGLYAAGEVTGGIHAGNRLGGNAILEILVSGRIAADSVNADNK